jgi:hypothetical protein
MKKALLVFGFMLAFCQFSLGWSPGVDFDLLRGDANVDMQVDIADPILIGEYLFQGGPAPPCMSAADANDDGQVDNTDAVYLYTFLFMGGPRPPQPYPNCGGDPTQDDLHCEWSSCP